MTSSYRRSFVWLAAIGLLTAAAPHAAVPHSSMHLSLVKAEPAINGSVTAAPHTIRLFYSQEPQVQGTSIHLLTSAKKEVALEATKADEKDKKIISADLKEHIGTGTYTVSWRAMSKDGHVLKDTFTFSVKNAEK